MLQFRTFIPPEIKDITLLEDLQRSKRIQLQDPLSSNSNLKLCGLLSWTCDWKRVRETVIIKILKTPIFLLETLSYNLPSFQFSLLTNSSFLKFWQTRRTKPFLSNTVPISFSKLDSPLKNSFSTYSFWEGHLCWEVHLAFKTTHWT